ncbi:MAG: LacI family DNA-binding transcriptional regulator [Candidatus Competibacter sp.]|jgi:LacI family transcriptional regulator|nr:LacI family DNA-binding transcriptional regulator [Candidatus Competibacteraceae bacterium]
MVTLKDIGRRLGLSVTQVSRALGGYSDVSDETRKRVEDAVRQLGYHPNPTALKLRSGRSGIVGLVVSENSEQEESNILLEILLGLAAEFWKRDVLVVLNVMPKTGKTVDSYTRLFQQGAVDGFVVVSPSSDPMGIDFLMRARVPFVTHGRDRAQPQYSFVDLDNRAVGNLMASRLVTLGHKDIAFIDGPENSYSAQERLSSLYNVLAEYRIEPKDEFIHRGIMTEHFGQSAAKSLFRSSKPPPTAIIVGNMVLATGVMRALRELGLSVPADVSVVAHDDLLTRYPRSSIEPDLSGTRSPFSDAWVEIADGLTDAINGQNSRSFQKSISPLYVEGHSIAPSVRTRSR